MRNFALSSLHPKKVESVCVWNSSTFPETLPFEKLEANFPSAIREKNR